jgi:hypothetical protein
VRRGDQVREVLEVVVERSSRHTGDDEDLLARTFAGVDGTIDLGIHQPNAEPTYDDYLRMHDPLMRALRTATASTSVGRFEYRKGDSFIELRKG